MKVFKHSSAFFVYLLIMVVVGVQVFSTLYQAGASLGTRARLAYLEREKQTLVEKKIHLTQSTAAQITLSKARSEAFEAGFITITDPVSIRNEQTLAKTW